MLRGRSRKNLKQSKSKGGSKSKPKRVKSKQRRSIKRVRKSKTPNRMRRNSKNWDIHSNWEKEGKAMKPVAVFVSREKLNQKKCADAILNEFDLTKKGNVSPVWVQQVETNNFYFYVIFIAIQRDKSINNFLNEHKPIEDVEIFNKSLNIIKKSGLQSEMRKNISKITQSKGTTKNYVKDLEKIIIRYAKAWPDRIANALNKKTYNKNFPQLK